MSNETPNNDPLEFMKGMWGNMGFSLPGMVAPTFDTDELEKRLKDLKAVEGWLRMNLSMLQMTIQNLEMQKSALGTFRSMSEHFGQTTGQATGQTDEPNSQANASTNPFFQAMNPGAASEPGAEAAAEAPADEAALAKAAMWPWEMMNELNATVQAQLADANRQQARKTAAKKPASKAPAKKPAAKRKSAAAGK